MPEHTLRNCRILVVEDEYMLADELRSELGQSDAIVLGPVGTVGDAVRLIQAEARIDGALLDVNLRGETAFPAADLLAERGVPFVFTTGYDDAAIPSRFSGVTRFQKPVIMGRITQAIARVVHAQG